MTDQLQDYIKRTGTTQRELAARLDLSEEHVSRVINGKSPITPSFVGKFAQAYGFDVAAQVFGQRVEAAQ